MTLTVNHKSQAGYSLLELLVGMGVMIVIVGATMAIVNGSLKFSHSTFHVTDTEESLRTAHELINRDLTSAGDGLKSIGTITVPLAFASNWLTRTTVVDSGDPRARYLVVDAARGTDTKASAPFSYAGPLTEMVLLGCLSTRFPKTALKWDEKKMQFTNEPKANAYVKRTPRKGWEEKGI